MTRRTVRAACLAGAVLLAGCGTVNTTTTRPGPGDDAVAVRRDINDALSHLAIHATEVRLFENAAGTLEAQVDVANDGFRTRRFAYRFDWLDERGNVIPARNAIWKNASIPAGGSAVISSTALTPEAADFRLQVRRSN
jgi:uncharacterized protein YcfL